ncbi:hypothetical protein WJX81_000828 [Elliptochloris bilobata]|uniref:Uncharacterized protein n=1 Tax=Elliptochloris bilobata TaxID=381761 RepID=A0AAW1QNA7_9CHLO
MKGEHIRERLAREILRKLRLATEAEEKDDRDIICDEVFADITGAVGEQAREQLGVPHECRYFEVLAPYFSKKWDAAEGLLYVCRKLLSQPYIAPVLSALLYQWMLTHKDAGGAEQRQKHVNLLVAGVRQLLWGDVHGERTYFAALYAWLADEVVSAANRARLDTLPPQSRAKLLAVMAAFTPYYTPPEDLGRALAGFPAPSGAAEGARADGEGADFVITTVTDTMHLMREEQSLLRYLHALAGLRDSPFLARCKRTTRLRLQAELYSLTQVGGPRYVPRAVNAAAFRALDALFPMGALSRRAVSLAFRLMHPEEWLRAAAAAAHSCLRALGLWSSYRSASSQGP